MRRLLGVLLSLITLAGAAWLAFRVPDLPYETLEAAYSAPSSQFVTLENGGRVHYRDEGLADGPTIVMVHGFSASLHTWDAWVAALGDEYRLVRLDLPGHGLSRNFPLDAVGTTGFVETIDAISILLGLERFTIAGSSMGGHAAWAYTIAHPGKVDSLVLVGAAGWPPSAAELDAVPLVFKAMQNGLVQRLVKDLDVKPMIDRGLKNSFLDESFVTEAMVDRYAALNRGRGHRAAILHILSGKAERREATEADMATIDAPTLVMHGRHDKLVPVAHGERFAATIPDAELIIYENAGHLPQEEVATQSAADVDAFLDAIRTADLGPLVPLATQSAVDAVVADGLN